MKDYIVTGLTTTTVLSNIGQNVCFENKNNGALRSEDVPLKDTQILDARNGLKLKIIRAHVLCYAGVAVQ